MTDAVIVSPLRQRMIEDMTIRQFGARASLICLRRFASPDRSSSSTYLTSDVLASIHGGLLASLDEAGYSPRVEMEAMVAAYIDEFIMFCVGLWMTAVGFGYLVLPGNPATQPAWVSRLAGHFKWMGPLLLVIAIVLAVVS